MNEKKGEVPQLTQVGTIDAPWQIGLTGLEIRSIKQKAGLDVSRLPPVQGLTI